MANRVVGIDIGSTAIRAVEVERPDRAKPTLLRHAMIPLPFGAVSRGEVLEPNTVSACLKQLWSAGKFTSKKVVLGMGNQRVLVRDLTVAKAPRDRIREALPFHVQEMLPVPVADALLDFFPVSEAVSDSGPVVHGLLVAAVKDAVLGNVRAVESAGLTTTDVDLIPFALSRVLSTRSGVAGLAALVDIGASTTSVVIVKDGIPQFVRIISAGGDDVTKALRERLDLDELTAERLKREIGLAKEVKTIEEQHVVEVIYHLTGDLLTSLRNTISYYANTRPEEPVGRIILTGGGAQLLGLGSALAEMSRLSVEPGDPFASIALSRNLSAESLRANRSALAVALGLALRSAA
ncbi:type IV pilus assembly protein PilM [Leifsonia sp. NPDC102414]|uniref:type IV pilus assembly protein PilM n=1 Tax=Leifsonia sp. NPDC102414 TaxID=3364124 RepID=UPI0038167C9C